MKTSRSTIQGRDGFTRSNLTRTAPEHPELRDPETQAASLAQALKKLQNRIYRKLQGHKPEEAQALINRSARLYARLAVVLDQLSEAGELPPRPEPEPKAHKPRNVVLPRRVASRALYDQIQRIRKR